MCVCDKSTYTNLSPGNCLSYSSFINRSRSVCSSAPEVLRFACSFLLSSLRDSAEVLGAGLPRRGCDPRILMRTCWSTGELAVERVERRSPIASIRLGYDEKAWVDSIGPTMAWRSGDGSNSVSRAWNCWSGGSDMRVDCDGRAGIPSIINCGD